MIKVGIIGATGYAGVELMRLLLSHPEVEIAAISSVSFEGKALSTVYPSFLSLCDMECGTGEQVVKLSDVVFACLPHGLSQELAAQCVTQSKVFIDLGADFRLESEEQYTLWYGGEYADKELHAKAKYGLPELFRDKLKGCTIIANPGCYPTSIALALYPALKSGMVSCEGIIIDSKSGVTGAGRGLTLATHFPECNEAFSPYKVAKHRHIPEIEQSLSEAAGTSIKVTFVPHLLPINRGILSTCYAKLHSGVDEKQIRALYEDFYKDEYFVRILPAGTEANLKSVKCSNFCDISLHIDEHTGTLIAVSAIDNMVKGAAGQAIQNMNIAFGIDEKTGLKMVPLAF